MIDLLQRSGPAIHSIIQYANGASSCCLNTNMMVEEDDNAGPLSDSELEEETGEWTDWNADESGAGKTIDTPSHSIVSCPM